MKKNIIIYSCGGALAQVTWHTKEEYNILGIVDGDENKWGKTIEIDENKYSIYSPESIKNFNFDYIYIASSIIKSYQEILEKLKKLNIDESKIKIEFLHTVVYARFNFIKEISMFLKNKNGACAELGVYRGDTATYINSAFPKDELFLFDTFEGFDEQDCKIEKQNNFSLAVNNKEFSDTSIEIVKGKLKHPEKSHFIKGYFPQTTSMIKEDIKFKFVNIDVDLYKPIYDGCVYFYEKLVDGGVMLIHDYFNPNYKGTKEAVDRFAKEKNLRFMPIGDGLSVFFVK